MRGRSKNCHVVYSVNVKEEKNKTNSKCISIAFSALFFYSNRFNSIDLSIEKMTVNFLNTKFRFSSRMQRPSNITNFVFHILHFFYFYFFFFHQGILCSFLKSNRNRNKRIIKIIYPILKCEILRIPMSVISHKPVQMFLERRWS